MTKIFPLKNTFSTTRLLTNEQPCLGYKFETLLVLPLGENRQAEGGLRTLELYKSSLIHTPLITVITVVYNGEHFLEQTIQSIINQTYENIEYIIIDGGSTDGTIAIIKKYEHAIDYWVSEKDEGIYDAMNKGITLVSGAWINFMNCGDSFYQPSVVDNIFSQHDNHDSDIIFGDHMVIYPKKTRLVKAGYVTNLWRGSQFCHQSSFVKSSMHKIHKFNSLNRVSGDFEFFYNAKKNNKKFKYKNIVVSSISAGGVSDIKRIDSIVGWWNVVEKNYKVNLYYIYRMFLEVTKLCVKKIKKILK
ncbi:MAG: glycosyltransferase involved in cell wall biosynthesis [Flavobacteriaceae bacterium]|jgi:glycosyltransferase involved in cell wall biosynthesis